MFQIKIGIIEDTSPYIFLTTFIYVLGIGVCQYVIPLYFPVVPKVAYIADYNR